MPGEAQTLVVLADTAAAVAGHAARQAVGDDEHPAWSRAAIAAARASPAPGAELQGRHVIGHVHHPHQPERVLVEQDLRQDG